jgi:hypothetical protein
MEAKFKIATGFRGAGQTVTLYGGVRGRAIEQYPNGRIGVTGFLRNRDTPAEFTLFYDLLPRDKAAAVAIADANIDEALGRRYAAELAKSRAEEDERSRLERAAKERQRELETKAIEYHPKLVKALRDAWQGDLSIERYAQIGALLRELGEGQ